MIWIKARGLTRSSVLLRNGMQIDLRAGRRGPEGEIQSAISLLPRPVEPFGDADDQREQLAHAIFLRGKAPLNGVEARIHPP